MSASAPVRKPYRRPAKQAVRHASTATPSTAPAADPLAPVPQAQQSNVQFKDIKGLRPDLIAAIPFSHCTEVQAVTLPVILDSHDVLAQAKTGTGKTMGFLIPAIQHLLQRPYPQQGQISILVISPTRELAQQIALEARGLLHRLDGGKGTFGVQCVVGGTNVNKDIQHLATQRSDILVATPGRAIDLLQKGGLQARLSQLATLVLDEADRLLDQGFRKDLTTILNSLPNRKSVPRQTLLFSATIPEAVHSIASLALNPGHKFISTINEEDSRIHERVKQELIVVPQRDILPATLGALDREAAKSAEAKIIVFLPTARAAGLFYSVFSTLNVPYPVWEIHSRLSQSRRTKVTEEFRQARRGVLFSSDVVARGLDIKGITAVIQAGVPSSVDQYIHRLGRTARAGADGHGVLILGDFESYFLNDKHVKSDLTFHAIAPGTESELAGWHAALNAAMDNVSPELKGQAYAAWLGYYKSLTKSLKWSSAELVANANRYSRETLRFGPTPPGLLAKTVGMMGLKGTPGLNITKQLPDRPNPNQAPKRRPEAREGGVPAQNGGGAPNRNNTKRPRPAGNPRPSGFGLKNAAGQ